MKKKYFRFYCGIYAFVIAEKYYVGKDSMLWKNKRKNENINNLKKNKHFNKPMQDAFNRDSNFKFIILERFYEKKTDEFLSSRERFWIEKYDSYNNGWNRTLGGTGTLGIKYSQKTLKQRSVNSSGNKNGMSKTSLDTFIKIIDLIEEGKNNNEIGRMVGLHERYVSLIRNKKRYKIWFETYRPNYKIISGKKYQTHPKLNEYQVKQIKYDNKYKTKTNVELGKLFKVDPSTISNIRHGKIWKGV